MIVATESLLYMFVPSKTIEAIFVLLFLQLDKSISGRLVVMKLDRTLSTVSATPTPISNDV